MKVFSDELIVSTKNKLGRNELKFVPSSVKAELYALINGRIINSSQKIRKPIEFKSKSGINFVNDVMEECPLYCDFLMSRGYKNILFITDSDVHDRTWYNEHTSRSEKLINFIPIIIKEFGYYSMATVLRPDQERYNGALHDVYKKFGIPRLMSPIQYIHGINYRLQMENWDGKQYDAVVFLNVNKKSDFTLQKVKNDFSPICKDGFEIVDIWHGDHEGRFLENEPETIGGDLDTVLFTKNEIKDTNYSSGRIRIMKDTIRVYK